MHWLLVNDADSITLNQAVPDVNRASLGAHEGPDALAVRLRDLEEACGNAYGEDRLKLACIQGLPKHLQVDAQQYNLQFTEHTLQQLASFTQGKHEQVKALQRLQPTPPKMYLARPCSRAGPKTPGSGRGRVLVPGRWSPGVLARVCPALYAPCHTGGGTPEPGTGVLVV